jgi:hypothetical protein
MDERILFDQFHEALDVEPRLGAYERMRFAMTDHPVALKRRPAFQMRWSKMGLRVAAVLAAAVLAIALGAAILATHHGPTGSVPAGEDPNVKAYQDMMSTNYNAMNALSSGNCSTIQDTGCAAAVKVLSAGLQKWVGDLNAFHTPTAYGVIDGQVRRHLSEVVTELNAAVAFQKAKNQNGFDLAMGDVVYERAWIDPVFFTIEGTYPKLSGSYRDAVNLARQALNACVGSTPGPSEVACTRLSAHETCALREEVRCESDVQAAATRIQTLLLGLTQNPAPDGVTANARRVMADLAQADTALLAITDALLRGDSAKADAGETAYASATAAADSDLGAA